VSTRISSDILGWWLSGNLCYRRQETPSVCSHRVTIHPYQGQRPCWGWGALWSQVQLSGTVYQPLCELQLFFLRRLVNIWTPAVQMIGSASEDYFWCALHIHSSSSSSLKDVLKSTVFICCRKAASDCSFLRKDGREFHARAAAAGNSRSPSLVAMYVYVCL